MDTSARRRRILLISVIPAVLTLCLLYLGPMRQDVWLPGYHQFADRRKIWGIPNCWNVITNVSFVAAALAGLRALRSPTAFLEKWERAAYLTLLISLALIGGGSAYYHLWPNNATLFWDRLPMAIAFSAILATTIGERIGPQFGGRLLVLLVTAGAASVVYWRAVDDLRMYVLVQFCAVAGLPLILLLCRPRYTGTAGIAAMVALYVVALLLDRFDRHVGLVLVTGGHPWKHVAAGGGALAYVLTVAHRRPWGSPLPPL